MKSPSFIKYILIFAGVVAVGVGLTLLVAPAAYYATSGVKIDGLIDLLSDLRGTGGSLLALGVLILAGAFRPELTPMASLVSTLFYLSYGLARGLAFFLDGRASGTVIFVMCAELTIGTLCALTISKQPRTSLMETA